MSRVAILFGAGPNIGAATASAFISAGYKIALVSRTIKSDSTPEKLYLSADFSDPSSIPGVFKSVTEKLGAPSVVIYNAGAATFTSPAEPFSASLASFTKSLNTNTVSVFAAIQESLKAFATLPDTASKTFIFTGNRLNVGILPAALDLTVGKSATARLITVAAEVYKGNGAKFYYADERKPDGNNVSPTNGEAHAKIFLDLSETKEQGPWDHTFVKGVGYKTFE